MKKTDIEIKLNNQIPKLNNELNKYHKNISLKFKGKVFLVDDNLNKIKELKNDDKIKKNGYYILKFIDEDNNIYFIKLKLCKYTILYFILLLTLIIFPLLYFLMPKTNTNINRQMLFDSLNYEYKFIGDRYVFNFNYGDENYKKVELYDKTTNTTKIHPGTSGQFYIKLNTVGGIKMRIKKSVSRFFGVVLATLMFICTPLSAFAAEINTPSVENSNFESSISEEGLARQSSIVSGTIGANGGTINIYPYLEQGSIFGRTICIRTSSSSSTGAIFLYLYDKNGKLVSNDWIMGVNDSLNKYMGWADYGTYTLKIVAQVNQQPVTIDAWWQ